MEHIQFIEHILSSSGNFVFVFIADEGNTKSDSEEENFCPGRDMGTS